MEGSTLSDTVTSRIPDPTQRSGRSIVLCAALLLLLMVAFGVVLLTTDDGKGAPRALPAASLTPISAKEWRNCMDSPNAATMRYPSTKTPVTVTAYKSSAPDTSQSLVATLTLTALEQGFHLVPSTGTAVCGVKVSVGASSQDAKWVYLRPTPGAINYVPPTGQKMLFVKVMMEQQRTAAPA